MQRWAKSRGIEFEKILVGIAADEAHRQPDKIRPLVDWGIDRDECARIILAEGLPLPRKSGCWCCPFQSTSQWRELLIKHPALFQRAAALEERLGEKVTFDPSGEKRLREYALQPPMFDFSDFYQPCLCRV